MTSIKPAAGRWSVVWRYGAHTHLGEEAIMRRLPFIATGALVLGPRARHSPASAQDEPDPCLLIFGVRGTRPSWGHHGNDTIRGTEGSDVILAGAGDDVVSRRRW